MGEIAVVVPVGPDESPEYIQSSYESLRELETPAGYTTQYYFVVDWERPPEVNFPSEVTVWVRDDSYGRRMGAVKWAIERLDDPQYVALFDIDLVPDTDFIVTCVEELESSEDCKLVTGRRYVTNEGMNTVTKLSAVGFRLLNVQQHVMQSFDTYNHTNGCNGVMEYDTLHELDCDLDQICPDVDLTERMYLNGDHMTVRWDTRLGEQAPTNWWEYYVQQRRWMTGAVQNFLAHYSRFLRASPRLCLGWFAQMCFPYVAVLFAPVVLIAATLDGETGPKELVLMVVWLCSYWAISCLSFVSVLAGRSIDWSSPDRV